MKTQILAGFVLILGTLAIHPNWFIPIMITLSGVGIITLAIAENIKKQIKNKVK